MTQDGSILLALDSYGYIWEGRNGLWVPLYTAGKQPWAHIATDQDGSIIGEFAPAFDESF